MSRSPSHVYETYIRARAEQIFEALTHPDWTIRYFHGTKIDSTWEKGSSVFYRYPDGRPAVDGEVLEVDAPRRLVITWHTRYDEEAAKDRPSRVTFEIEPLGEICRLTLVHDDFDGETATYRNVSRGWNAILCNLKTLLETGEAFAYPEG